jgi:hypothetical protein
MEAQGLARCEPVAPAAIPAAAAEAALEDPFTVARELRICSSMASSYGIREKSNTVRIAETGSDRISS